MTGTATIGGAPAGWYDDPAGQAEYRYWDGGQWTPGVVLDGRVAERPLPAPPGGLPVTDESFGIELPAQAVWTAVLGFVVGVVASAVLSVLADRVGLPDIAAVALGVTGLWAGLLGACVVSSRRYGTGQLAADFGLRFSRGDFVRGLGASVVARVAGAIAVVPVALALANRDVAVPVNGLLQGVDVNVAALAVFAVIALIGAPVIEELFFRGLLLRSLVSRWSVPVAIAVQAVVFALAHLSPLLGLENLAVLAVIAPVGVVFGRTARRRGLAASMVAHSLFNLVAVLAAMVALASG